MSQENNIPDEVKKYLKRKLKDIHQYQKDIYEFCISKGKLHRQKINKNIVYNIVGGHTMVSDNRLRRAINQMLTEERIRFIEHVEYQGDAYANEVSYEIDKSTGKIIVKIPPIRPNVQDNAFINDYLDSLFGEYSEFIKLYMAAYTYTNFQSLPVLVLYGPRGTSKSTYVDSLLRPIYPKMDINWDGMNNNFNPEVEKKLAVIEENSVISREQYNRIKSVTGSEILFLNQKYKEQVAVRNNLQIVIISNNNIPMYLKPSEYPVSELENQWFVWKTRRFFNKPDSNYREELKKRLGHYIRTELRSLYEDNASLFSEGRYIIKVPITSYEKKLFEANRSAADLVAQRIKSEILEDYESFLNHDPSNGTSKFENFSKEKIQFLSLIHKDNFVTNKLIRSYDLEGCKLGSVVKILTKKGILGETDRVFHHGKGYRGRYIENWEDLEQLRDKN